MLFEILIAIFLGIFFGCVTGLIPGIHINLVSLFLVSISGFFLNIVSLPTLAVFIIAMAITHTFLDPIPAIFLGAPEAETAMGVLPGHQLLLKGNGYAAVKLTIIGSLFGLLVALILFPLFLTIIPKIYLFLRPYLGYLLLIIVLYMIAIEKKKKKILWASLVFLFAGILGLIVFSLPNLKQPLFPLLSGLFGVSMLLVSLSNNTTIPKQTTSEEVPIPKLEKVKSVAAGVFSGSFVSFFPGLGPAQAAIIGSAVVGKIQNYSFLILVGAISTVNMLVSLVTLYTLEKARNGAVVAIQQLLESINTQILIILLITALIAGAIATYLALFLTKKFIVVMEKIIYKDLCIAIILLIAGLVLLFSGWIGLVVLLVATSIGLIPNIVNVKRSHSMGCLILPVALFFLL